MIMGDKAAAWTASEKAAASLNDDNKVREKCEFLVSTAADKPEILVWFL